MRSDSTQRAARELTMHRLVCLANHRPVKCIGSKQQPEIITTIEVPAKLLDNHVDFFTKLLPCPHQNQIVALQKIDTIGEY
jgi:hypothetical protein